MKAEKLKDFADNGCVYVYLGLGSARVGGWGGGGRDRAPTRIVRRLVDSYPLALSIPLPIYVACSFLWIDWVCLPQICDLYYDQEKKGGAAAGEKGGGDDSGDGGGDGDEGGGGDKGGEGAEGTSDKRSLLEDLDNGVSSIPAYVERSQHFIILVTTAEHENARDAIDPRKNAILDYGTWRKRGWCRLE